MDVEITLAGVIGDLARRMLADWMAEVHTHTQLLVPGGGAEAAEVIVMLDRAGLVILDVRQTCPLGTPGAAPARAARRHGTTWRPAPRSHRQGETA
jgi:hypothetical protein